MRPTLSRDPRRLWAVVMATALLAGSVGTAIAAGPASRPAASQLHAKGVKLTDGGQIRGDMSKAARKNGRTAIVVQLANQSVATYTGGVSGLKATNPKTRGAKSIDLKGTDTARYRAFLKGKQDAFANQLTGKVKGSKVSRRYDLILNAVAVSVPDDSVAAVAKLPGVTAVYPDTLEQPMTDTTPGFIGAPTVWAGLGGQESAGEGVIVGILDTGIWPEHPSFSDPDPSGKPYAAPPAAPDGARECQFSGGTNPGPAFTCNNKLIGAYRFMAGYDAFGPALEPGEFTSARDDDGHGTHTSSTSAGDSGVQASIFGIARGTISGIAPRAYVEMFKVCGAQGCFGSDSAAAVQAAIGDGVNVINFSIGGGANPYSDISELAFLEAYDAGVFVAASAGNSGPDPDTTEHRGPWVTTVGASTAPRAFVNTVHVTATGGATLDIAGVSLTHGVGPAPIVVNPNALCDAAAAPGSFAGKIVVCQRGNPEGRVADGNNVLQGGAVGMILYNGSAAQTDQETDNHFLPASHIQFDQGTALVAFIGSHTGVVATISQGVTGSQQADVMASFSSRGGPDQSLGVSKPDITAPGVQILAGASPQHVGIPSGPQGELFQSIAGTSMSSPHIAGSAALIKDLHPTWTPGQIRSALMTTARTKNVVKEDGVTPADAFDFGSGRVNLNRAGSPGLTFDATGADYIAHEDDLYTVNYPSIYHPTMPGKITLTRTAHSVLGYRSEWKLTTSSPSDLDIGVPREIRVRAGGDTSFKIALDASRVPLGETRFGKITLTEKGGKHRVLHLPVTIVRNQEAVELTKACDPTDLSSHGVTSCTITVANPTFDAVTYSVKDRLPDELKLVKDSVVGATIKGRDEVKANGTLPAADPPTVAVAAVDAPGSYVALADFPDNLVIAGGDETIDNLTGFGSFSFGGESWDTIGMVSNGYAVVGGGTGSDIDFLNQKLPDETRPNNVLAPFWTDLNPDNGGEMLANVLCVSATQCWLVLEWTDVPEFSGGGAHTMQIWLGLDDDGTPESDVTFDYGPSTGNGDGGFATVGAENKFGNSGGNIYYDGAGSLPSETTLVTVTSEAGAVSTKTITFDAKAQGGGRHGRDWENCATLTSDAFLGISYSCVNGTISR